VRETIGPIDDSAMTSRQEVEDAVGVAVGRTRDAQGRVVEELEHRGAPQSDTTSTVIRRAEDLDELVHDPAGDVEEVGDRTRQERSPQG
jgi:hypothetical protein